MNHIDVDNGDATLFVSPSGRTLLVDSGKNGHGSRIRAVLQQAGVTQIDHFVATHYHEDHYGGVDDLTAAPAIPILDGYDRGDKEFLPNSKLTSVTYSDYDTAIGSWADALTRGETIPLDPAMTVTSISASGVVKRCAGFSGSRPVDGGKSLSRFVSAADTALFIEKAAQCFIAGDRSS